MVVEWFCESTLVGAMAFEFGVVFVLVLLSCFNVNSVESDDGECCSFTLPRLFFLLFLFGMERTQQYSKFEALSTSCDFYGCHCYKAEYSMCFFLCFLMKGIGQNTKKFEFLIIIYIIFYLVSSSITKWVISLTVIS